MARLTKTKMVKNHLERGETITSLDAIQLYGATRLSSIIFNLRQRGLDIATLPTTITDRFGNSTTFAKYRLLNTDFQQYLRRIYLQVQIRKKKLKEHIIRIFYKSYGQR